MTEKLNAYFDTQRKQIIDDSMGHLNRASEVAPDTMAQAQRVSESTGLPAMELAQNPDQMQAREDEASKRKLLERSPSLVRWIADPENAALSQDELTALGRYDQLLTAGTDLDNPDGTGFSRAVERGFLGIQMTGPALRADQYSRALAYGTMDEPQLLRETFLQVTNLDELPEGVTIETKDDALDALTTLISQQRITPNLGFESFVSQLEVNQLLGTFAKEDPAGMIDAGAGAIERLTDLGERRAAIPFSPNAERLRAELAKDTTLKGTGLAMLADPLGTAAFLGEVSAESVPTLTAALIAGVATRSPVVGAALLGGGAVTQETGQSALQYLQEQGVPLETRADALALLANPALLEDARQFGMTRGIMIAAFEVLGQGAAARMVLKSPIANSIMQTSLQAGTGAGGEAAAQLATGEELNAQDILIEGLAEAPGVVVEAPLAVIGQNRRDAAAAEGITSARSVTEINEAVTETKMRERSPKSFRRFLQNGGFDKQNMYIDGGVLADAVAQDANLVQQLGVTADAIQRAAEAGHSVPVNLATYMENIPGRNPTAETLFVKNGSLKPTVASKAQSDTYFTEERPERAQEAAEAAQEATEVATVREEVAKQVSGQLRAAGQAPAAARASGELYGAFFQTLADRYGRDVSDSMALQIVGPGGQTEGPRQSGRSFTQPEPMKGMEDVAALVADNAPFEQIVALPQVQQAMEKINALPETRDSWDFSSDEFVGSRPYVLRDGTQVAGVEALFDEIEQVSASYAKGEVVQEFRVDILLGPPAAGKSTVAEMIAPAAGARIVDSDDVKKLIPEFEGGVGANAVHQESSVLTKVFLDRVLARGDNVVIPKVGDDAESIRKLMAKLKGAGYEVNLINMEVAEGEANRRNFGRFAATGRLVPPVYVNDVGTKPALVYNELKGEADGYASYDNNVPFGEVPIVTEDTRRGAGGESTGERPDDASGADTAADEAAAGGSSEADGPVEGRQLQLNQERRSSVRGQITIPNEGVMNGTTVIELFKTANLSTFLHESGHFFLEAMQTVATADDAPDQLVADIAVINEWMGRDADSTAPFTTQQHEMWAEAFEVYLMEGKAPTPSLKAAFAKFATWLTNVYKRAMNIGTQPSPEIKEVMDRMLATEEEIALARQETDSQALFTSIPPGMSEAEWTPYQKLVQREEAETQGRALERAMAKVRRRRTKEYQTRLDQIEEEVRARLVAERTYRTITGLGNGDFGKTARFNKKQLVDMFGDAILGDLSRERHGTARHLYDANGVDIEIAAETFGYDSVGEMINDMRAAPPLDDAVDTEAAAQIENELGDPLDETSIREEAEAALKNGLATERVAREAATLTRAARGDTGPSRWQQQNAAAKQEATERVDQLTVREALGYRQYLRASQRASREAQRQLSTVVRRADGTPQPGSRQALEAAAEAKRRQLLNDHMYRIAREKSRRLEAARKRFGRMQKKTIRANIGPDFMDVIDSILDQYSFHQVPIREVGRRASIRDLYQKMIDENRGAELAIPLDVMARVEQVHYTELTVAELEGVVDAVDNVAHMGRSTTKQLQADAQFDLLTAMDNIEDRADRNLTDKPQARERGERPGIGDFYRQFQLHVLNADSILRDIDGDETALGPAYNSVKRGIDRGVGAADARRQASAKEIAEIYRRNLGSYRDIKKLREDKRVYPELGDQPLTRLGLLSIALNSGNEQNFERLTNEQGKSTFRKDAVQTVLSNELTEAEWRFVQDIWDYLDGYWTEIRDQERRYTGVTPKKVSTKLMIEGAPDFVKGGYYPIRYDPGISSNADDMERAKLATEGTVGVFGKAQTAHGHAKERVASTGRPLDLDLSIIDNHVFNVIHDLELRGPVRDAARIVYSERFGDIMNRKGRGEDTRALKAWLEDVAVGDKVGAYGMSRWFRWMRGGFTLSAIGFKVSTIMIQPLGLTQSVVQVGYGAMVRGYSQYMKQGPARAHAFATDKSAIMTERIRTFDKDISQITQELSAGATLQRGYKRFVNFYLPWAYAGMQHMQYWVVDLPTWMASYEQALRNGSSDDDAVVIADRDVRIAQGSGLMSDRGMLERGRTGVTDKPNEVARLFTVLGSYMFGKFNLAYRRVRGTDFSNPAALAKLTMDLSMLFVVEAMLVYLLRNGWPDEDDDEPPMPLIAAREGFYTFLGTMPVFRDVASTLQGFGGGAAYAEYTGAMGMLTDSGIDLASGEFDRRTLEGLLGFGGTAFFLPSGQLNDMLDAVWTRDFEVEDDAIVNLLESMTGLPVGGEDES